jgi:hypothetical protein
MNKKNENKIIWKNYSDLSFTNKKTKKMFTSHFKIQKIDFPKVYTEKVQSQNKLIDLTLETKRTKISVCDILN